MITSFCSFCFPLVSLTRKGFLVRQSPLECELGASSSIQTWRVNFGRNWTRHFPASDTDSLMCVRGEGSRSTDATRDHSCRPVDACSAFGHLLRVGAFWAFWSVQVWFLSKTLFYPANVNCTQESDNNLHVLLPLVPDDLLHDPNNHSGFHTPQLLCKNCDRMNLNLLQMAKWTVLKIAALFGKAQPCHVKPCHVLG